MVNVLRYPPYEVEGVSFDPERWGHEHRADALPTTSGERETLLPILVDADVPADGVEQFFVRALSTGPATIDWHGVWPDAPELGLLANSKYEGMQAVFNTDDVDWERPAGDHTVFAHMTKFGNLPPAQWLAGQVDAPVLGVRGADGERNGQGRAMPDRQPCTSSFRLFGNCGTSPKAPRAYGVQGSRTVTPRGGW
ncbi:hypothetical protein ACWC4A_43555 [Streptomyces mirabilis]